MKKKIKFIILSVLFEVSVFGLSFVITTDFMKEKNEINNNELNALSLSSCVSLELISNKSESKTTPYKFRLTFTCDSYDYTNIYLATLNTNKLDYSTLEYLFTKKDSDEVISAAYSSSNYSNSISDFDLDELDKINKSFDGDYVNVLKIYDGKLNREDKEFDLYLFINDNMLDSSFKTSLIAKAFVKEKDLADLCKNGQNLSSCIKLYGDLGSEKTNIYIHSSQLLNGANDNSYRYSGSNPDNYVCFGTDVSPCPYDNLYRIIGVFGDNVKLIKYDYANSNLLGITGTYSTSTYLASDFLSYKGEHDKIDRYFWGNDLWSYSYLNTVNLNTNYIKYLNNEDIKWVQKIEDIDWIVGERLYSGILETPIYNVYQNEIVNQNTDTFKAKIGLMYVSDYGYAASPKYWTNNLFEYDNYEIKDENWMYMGLDELTILRYTDLKRAYSIDSNGSGGYTNFNNLNQSDLEVDWSLALRPVFYLTSNTTYISGIGTINEPIKIN